MIEIEHLLFVCAWLIVYLILQLCTWLVLRPWLSPTLALPASFAASLLFSCLISWYLAWLEFPPAFTPGIFLILAGIVLHEVQRARKDILSDLKEGKWHYVLFFIVFFTMLIVRMLSPNIDGGEKFMDHAFLASIMRAPLVPPPDPWFAGETLNVYYYLGYWCFAVLAIIAKIPSWIAFQLVLPTVSSVAAVQLYGIGKLLLKRVSLLPVICLFIVNPAFIYQYISETGTFYVLWNSSRVIEAAITEYPLFTFLFGDVHAHAMALFNQTFFILIIVYLFTQWKKLVNAEKGTCAILIGISLGTMPGLHSWDALIYGMIFGLAAIFIWYQISDEENRESGTWFSIWCAHLYTDILGICKKPREVFGSRAVILYLWILVPVVTLVSYAPFFAMMRAYGALGIGFVHTRTTLTEFLLVFGWFLVLMACTLYSDINKRPYLLLIAVPFIVTGYLVIGLVLVLLAYIIARHEGVTDFLIGCGLLLVLLCELVYMVDGMGPDWYRMNTIFKSYLPAWLLIGIGSLCSVSIHAEKFIHQTFPDERRGRINDFITKCTIGVTLVAILVTPFIGTLNGFGDITLNGHAWLGRHHPDDYAAIEYLHSYYDGWSPGTYAIVEAGGGDYQYNARISSATGIPTILGWSFHEMNWRADNPPGWYGERTTDITTIYEQPDQSSEIMAKYNANLLIVGLPEREKYQIPEGPDAYFPYLVPIFTEGETTIYERV
jgi:YYY domain-containing protein